MKLWQIGLSLAILATACAGAARDQAPAANDATPLAGTSWQLVRFQGGDDAVLTPDDGSKYTITFGRDGVAAVRLDCNRGRGPWTSPGANRLELGTLAITRAFCGPGSLHDQIVKQWGNIRSYVVKDGHLFLSLMADGGIYEFEPVTASTAAVRAPGASSVPAEDSKTLRACMDTAETQSALNRCAGDEAARVDRATDETYSRLLAMLAGDQNAVAKVDASRVAWQTYRDTYIEAMYPARNKQAEYGSIYPMEVNLIRASLTRQHLSDVEKLLEQHGP
jgi:uncharacterized protein YecT (DUF1311 family)/heat shock protein HslJ